MPLNVSYYTAKLHGHRHCGIRDGFTLTWGLGTVRVQKISNFIAAQDKSPFCQVWKYNIFSFLCNIARPRDKRIISLSRWESFMVGYHPANFGDHKHWSCVDTMFLVVEGQDSICSHLNLLVLFISDKEHVMSCSHT